MKKRIMRPVALFTTVLFILCLLGYVIEEERQTGPHKEYVKKVFPKQPQVVRKSKKQVEPPVVRWIDPEDSIFDGESVAYTQ
jgi:hypothetical protein